MSYLASLKKKSKRDLGGPRGRMISDSDRVTAIELINEARASGSRLKPACDELNISVRTYERWIKEGEVKRDQRPLVKRHTPKNKLTKEERDEIIKTVNSPEYADLAPSQIIMST